MEDKSFSLNLMMEGQTRDKDERKEVQGSKRIKVFVLIRGFDLKVFVLIRL